MLHIGVRAILEEHIFKVTFHNLDSLIPPFEVLNLIPKSPLGPPGL
jgi:hypothetical protein